MNRSPQKKSLTQFLSFYLLVFVLFFSAYSFLNWLLTIKMSIITFDTSWIDLIIPSLIAFVLSYFVFRTRIAQFNYTSKSTQIILFFLIPASLAIPIAASQDYIKDVFYSIQEVEKPSDVSTFPDERFFRIHSYFIVADRFSVSQLIENVNIGSRRHNLPALRVQQFYFVPIYDDRGKLDKMTNLGLGLSFERSIQKSLSADQRQDFIKKSAAAIQQDFEQYDFYKDSYFEVIKTTQEAVYGLTAASTSLYVERGKTPTILVKRYGSFKKRIEKEAQKSLIVIAISILATLTYLISFNRAEPSTGN